MICLTDSYLMKDLDHLFSKQHFLYCSSCAFFLSFEIFLHSFQHFSCHYVEKKKKVEELILTHFLHNFIKNRGIGYKYYCGPGQSSPSLWPPISSAESFSSGMHYSSHFLQKKFSAFISYLNAVKVPLSMFWFKNCSWSSFGFDCEWCIAKLKSMQWKGK